MVFIRVSEMAIHWGSKLKQLREDRGWTQEDLSSRSGISRESIAQYELGYIKTCPNKSLNAFAHAFDTNTAELSSYFAGGALPSNRIPTGALIRELSQRYEAAEIIEVPLLGYVNAGIPAPVEQVDLGTVLVCKNELSGAIKLESLFALYVSGDSLIGDDIEDGDIVIIERDSAIIDGKIYILNLNNEFVARHLHNDNGTIILTSSNGKYARITPEELEISGRVVLSGNWKKH